jgi:hypothetical protein
MSDDPQVHRALFGDAPVVPHEAGPTHIIELPCRGDPTDPEEIKARAEACGFCHGRPVGNAAVWVHGPAEEGPLPCPRCGVTTLVES